MNRILKPFFVARKYGLAAALGGSTLGLIARTYRKDDRKALQFLSYASVAGVSGFAFGYGVASIKGLNAHIHGLIVAGSFFVISTSFLVYRNTIIEAFDQSGFFSQPGQSNRLSASILNKNHPVSTLCASAISGGITGLALSIIFLQGSKSILPYTLQGIGIAIVGQFMYNIYYAWKLKKIMEYNYPELVGSPRKVSDGETTKNTNVMGSLESFFVQRPKSSVLDEEAGILEFKLELLQEKEKMLQSQLSSDEKDK